MTRRITSFILVLITTLHLHAVTVTTTAGELAAVVTDCNITSLTVNGTLDARDFKFIADELYKLKGLNLTGVTILAYNSTLDDQMIVGEYQHKANTLPYCAFAGMTTLQTLKLPKNLTAIDYGAVAGCSNITSITLPTTLEKIGDDAFNSCSSLTEITIGGKINYLGNSAFAHCTNLSSVVINTSQPLVIGNDAFADCTNLSSVTIGPNVTKIGDGAFNGCSALKTIDIMNESKLEDFGDKAFYNSALETIDFERTPLLKHLGAWALARTNLKSVNIPANIKRLDEGTLFYNKYLTSVALPKTLTYLPDYMLAGCERIVGAPFMTQNMGNIGDYALYNQSQHEEISVPFKVYYIGTQAMAGMTGLNEITSEPLQVPELGEDVWKGINQSQVKLNVNSESIDEYSAAEQWMNFLIGVAQLRGDINGDGFVNTADATAERLFIVDGNTQGINTELTDVNRDGQVNVGDIVSIYNIIHGTIPAERPHRGYFDDTLEGNGEAVTNKSVKLDILLDNTINYTAFQLNITAPNYITIDNATLSGRCVGHEIYLKNLSAGKFMIVGFSPAGDDIEGYSGVIMTLNISSTKTITNNDKIALDDIIFVDYNENVYKRHDVDLNLLGISAVDNITVDESDRLINVYNTQGQLLRQGVARDQATQGLTPGIYIVGNKKVIVR